MQRGTLPAQGTAVQEPSSPGHSAPGTHPQACSPPLLPPEENQSKTPPHQPRSPHPTQHPPAPAPPTAAAGQDQTPPGRRRPVRRASLQPGPAPGWHAAPLCCMAAQEGGTGISAGCQYACPASGSCYRYLGTRCAPHAAAAHHAPRCGRHTARPPHPPGVKALAMRWCESACPRPRPSRRSPMDCRYRAKSDSWTCSGQSGEAQCWEACQHALARRGGARMAATAHDDGDAWRPAGILRGTWSREANVPTQLRITHACYSTQAACGTRARFVATIAGVPPPAQHPLPRTSGSVPGGSGGGGAS